ncbi:hypothetical protein E2C01_009263 [Portunus trituberculatus]|uniref:Uncharacterized protein n=1 Tax=Portunus trituberculatus TaxID=210409 RepID=A0A5B7D450_PORTR|nr:hypothetical protein [Portunus trituberculatus]
MPPPLKPPIPHRPPSLLGLRRDDIRIYKEVLLGLPCFYTSPSSPPRGSLEAWHPRCQHVLPADTIWDPGYPTTQSHTLTLPRLDGAHNPLVILANLGGKLVRGEAAILCQGEKELLAEVRHVVVVAWQRWAGSDGEPPPHCMFSYIS